MILSHPSIPFFLVGALMMFFSGTVRKALLMAAPIVSIYLLLKAPADGASFHLFTYEFLLLRSDSLAHLFVITFIVFGLLANLYALHAENKMHHVAAQLYIGASIGAVLVGDLVTLFVFWEIMAVVSAFLIWNQSRKTSEGATYRYFLVHLTGGLAFFAGLMMKLLSSESLVFNTLSLDTLSGTLIFVGFMVNAALVPFHAWLPDAYPEGTPTSSIYLSAFTTKVAVYVFARSFAGEEILIWLGAIAAVYGVVYALMENDMRRLLSYHIVCQIGYMICGIGIGSELGVNGGVGHAIGNILFKGLLFMATGALIHMAGTAKLSELGGMAKHSKLILLFYMIGAFAISGVPLLNGYITKSFLLISAEKAHLEWLEIVLTVVAIGTFLSIALKLAYFAFIAEPAKKQRRLQEIPWNMHAAMAGASLLCLGIGIFPKFFYDLLPYEVHKNPFTLSHIVHTLQFLAGTFLGFLLIVRTLHTKDAITLDMDWFYRKGGKIFVNGICMPIRLIQESIQGAWTYFIKNLNIVLSEETPEQTIAPVEQPFFWITLASLGVGLMLVLF